MLPSSPAAAKIPHRAAPPAPGPGKVPYGPFRSRALTLPEAGGLLFCREGAVTDWTLVTVAPFSAPHLQSGGWGVGV